MEQNGTAAATIDRIDTRATAPDLASWLTKAEAAHALGSSEKHIERLAKRGEVQQSFRKAPGQARVSIFHPGDVEKVLAKQTPAFRVQETAVAAVAYKPQFPSFDGLALQLARLADVAQTFNAQHEKQVYVSLDEAERLTGLSAGTIRRLVREGRVARLSRKYRRADLEAL